VGSRTARRLRPRRLDLHRRGRRAAKAGRWLLGAHALTAFVTLRLPDGSSATVSTADAYKLQQRLLALGLVPGAAAAAGKLRDGASSWFPGEQLPDILFNARQAPAVKNASDGLIDWGH
jgi:hypothetical protein